MDWEKLFRDKANGDLDPRVVLIVDNDNCTLHCETGDEDEEERIYLELKEKYGTGNGYGDFVDLAKAAGLNAQWC